MNLSELIHQRRDDIMSCWTARVRGILHPEGMARMELVDHLPSFLDEVADALAARESPETSATAAEHGVQRLGLGFNLDSVVREYGTLRDAVVETADAHHVVMRDFERDVLFDCVITGVAGAVSEYQRQRDAEQQRQASEHFAFVAHELRNPLGSAVVALGALKRRGRLGQDRAGQVLERGLTTMTELIESSLRLAQIGAGITVRRERVSLRKLLEDAETEAAPVAEEKEVGITLNLEKDVQIDVDARLVRSALTNLVRNAVKFSHDGGKVEIRAEAGDARVTIEVEDQCGGLPPGSVEKAFSPFVQMGTDRSGFGLGLAIAKQAADAHGGSIRVQNLPGKGCIFVLELPAP